MNLRITKVVARASQKGGAVSEPVRSVALWLSAAGDGKW